jgi:hypothetical protein
VIPLLPGDKLSVLRHRGRTPKPRLWMNLPYPLLIADPNRTNYYSSARAAPQEGGAMSARESRSGRQTGPVEWVWLEAGGEAPYSETHNTTYCPCHWIDADRGSIDPTEGASS